MDRQVITVTQLNTFVKDYIDALPPLRQVSVKGEVSNLTKHKTGHYYFTLKDEGSVIKTVMFRSDAEKLDFEMENGQKVIITGRISVFVRDGSYQLYAVSAEQEGIGSLYIAFEKLKAKLAGEGLFDAAHKKPIPKVPFRLGIVTAPTGAAIQDMKNIAARRFPLCEIILYPSLVQGKDAAPEIISGIEYFDRKKCVDVIIIGRGGGSIEDLWAFNDEKLARVVYNCETPIISAVGHEIDFTITDFVADLRAPTPSAAVELALPDKNELKRKFGNINTHNAASLAKRLQSERKLISLLASSRCLTDPVATLDDRRMSLLRDEELLNAVAERIIAKKKEAFDGLSRLLDSYNPLGVLKRGYSVAYDESGAVIKSKSQLPEGRRFILKVSDGDITARAERKVNCNGG